MPEFNYDRIREEGLRDFSQEIENAYRRGFQEAAKAIKQQGRQVNTVQGVLSMMRCWNQWEITGIFN